MQRLISATSAIALLVVGLSVFAAGAAAAPGGTIRIDDRALMKSKGEKGWTAVSSRRAYKGTLSRTRNLNATAATRAPATGGGSVTFEAGPGRGKFVVTAGKARKTVATGAKSVRLRTVAFRGAGPVTLKVTKPGPNGVYLDAVELAKPGAAAKPTGSVSNSPGTPAAPGPLPPPASSCPAGTSDGGTLTSAPGTPLRTCQLPGRVTSNLVLQKVPNLVYSLSGPVEVGSDVGGGGTRPGGNAVTLTVEPGVVVIADQPEDALLVNRGSRISAVGLPSLPIVFTSRSNLLGAATEASNGLWGGITLLGRGPISDCNTAVPGGSVDCQQTLPNFTASYGGNVPTDSSGSLRYVQIRFAGAGAGGAGLRLAGVGNATLLDHIQVLNSAGDGLGVFGGRVSASSLALTGAADDLLSTDLGFRGTFQYLVAVQSGAASGDALIEADANGNEDALPRQYTRVSNATLVGRSAVQNRNMVLLRGGTDFALLNSVVTGTLNCLDVDETGGTTTRAADVGLQDLGAPVFRSVGLTCPNPFTEDGNVAAATIASIFGTGTNNNNATHPLSLAGLVNGPSESAISPTNPTTFNADTFGTLATGPSAFSATTYVGAIQNPADERFRGWTCETTFAGFGGGLSCLASPL